jgi:hypothetical protein
MNSIDTSHSDEIDLIDLWVILVRHFKVFIATFLLVFVAGIIVTFTRSPAYDYTLALEIGGIRNNSGSFDLVAQPEAVIASLKSAIIPSVLQDYANEHPDFDPNSVTVKLDNQDKSDIVVLTIKAGFKTPATGNRYSEYNCKQAGCGTWRFVKAACRINRATAEW